MNLDVYQLRRDIDALLLEYPDLAEDEVLRADMLNGETSLIEVMTELVRRLDNDKLMVSAISERVKQLSQRRSRFTGRIEYLRAVMLKVMQSADLKKLELPEATLSQRASQPQIIGEGIDGLPEDLLRITVEPDRVKIREALLERREVPGYVMSNAAPTLAINVK